MGTNRSLETGAVCGGDRTALAPGQMPRLLRKLGKLLMAEWMISWGLCTLPEGDFNQSHQDVCSFWVYPKRSSTLL